MTSVITDRPLSIREAARHLDDGESGGVVLFVGRVRPDRSGNRRVVALDYEADRKLALAQLRKLEKEARRRFGARRVFVIHRVGRLRVGIPSVMIGVAAPHRAEAFAAARFLIEELKREVPIWKSDRWGRARAARPPRRPLRPRRGRSRG
jgi:molybdopterin synthase catalytic subunit